MAAHRQLITNDLSVEFIMFNLIVAGVNVVFVATAAVKVVVLSFLVCFGLLSSFSML